MKRTLVITFLITLIIASQTWAAPQFGAGITATRASSDSSPGKFVIQGSSGVTNGDDGSTLDKPVSKAPVTPIRVAAYKTNGQDGWNGMNGFYTRDSRAMLVAGQTVTEDIYVWAAPGTSPENVIISEGWSGMLGSSIR